jgi:ABC-type multidrug transport system ATPase subunit
MKILSANNITKSYGNIRALKSLTFDVEQGEIYGIIGPDGAGKTTLFRILTTLMLADSGTATVAGLDVVNDYKKIRNIIGYMPGRFSLYQDLTVEENLNFFATVFQTTIKKNYHLIEDIYKQIEPFKTRRAGKLSGGMKQKLALCCALIHKPTVLFLDEPTTGVDPVSRKEFWDMLMKLKAQGITILVSTPYMDEASLCDRIALISNGEFMQIDTPQNIIANYPETLWSVQTNDMHTLLKDLRGNSLVKSAYTFGDSIHVTFNEELGITNYESGIDSRKSKHVILSEAKELKNQKSPEAQPDSQFSILNFQFQKIQPTIEDCFMLLSKNQAQ